ncbi:MAG: hypothetical protein WA771_02360 [Chthoniobacterales bacterium]
MTKIHPTAVVDGAAEIGDDVEIGPGVVVGPDVTVGNGCRILAHAVLERWVTLGAENVVGYSAVVGSPPQDLSHEDGWKSEVRIGVGNTLREHVTVHRAAGEGMVTAIGDGNILMTGAHLAHNGVVGNRTIIANN